MPRSPPRPHAFARVGASERLAAEILQSQPAVGNDVDLARGRAVVDAEAVQARSVVEEQLLSRVVAAPVWQRPQHCLVAVCDAVPVAQLQGGERPQRVAKKIDGARSQAARTHQALAGERLAAQHDGDRPVAKFQVWCRDRLRAQAKPGRETKVQRQRAHPSRRRR